LKSLPESFISAGTTDSFKNKLGKLINDYNAELTGIGLEASLII